jgi:hypothetical protein
MSFCWKDGKYTQVVDSDTTFLYSRYVSIVVIRCLGFQPIEDEEHQLIDRRLVAINRHLKAYQKWYDMLDGWLVIEIEDLDW